MLKFALPLKRCYVCRNEKCVREGVNVVMRVRGVCLCGVYVVCVAMSVCVYACVCVCAFVYIIITSSHLLGQLLRLKECLCVNGMYV